MRAKVAIFLLVAFAFVCAREFIRAMTAIITFMTTALVVSQ